MNKEISNLIRKKIQLLIKEEDIDHEADQIIKKILKDIKDSRFFLYCGKNPELECLKFKILIYDCDDPSKLDMITELVKTNNQHIDEYATFVRNSIAFGDGKSNICNYMTYAKYLRQVLKSKGLSEGLSVISQKHMGSMDLAIIRVDLEAFLDKEVELLGEEKGK